MSAAAAAPAPAAAAAADDDRCAPAVCCIPPRADTPRCGGVADCEPALSFAPLAHWCCGGRYPWGVRVIKRCCCKVHSLCPFYHERFKLRTGMCRYALPNDEAEARAHLKAAKCDDIDAVIKLHFRRVKPEKQYLALCHQHDVNVDYSFNEQRVRGKLRTGTSRHPEQQGKPILPNRILNGFVMDVAGGSPLGDGVLQSRYHWSNRVINVAGATPAKGAAPPALRSASKSPTSPFPQYGALTAGSRSPAVPGRYGQLSPIAGAAAAAPPTWPGAGTLIHSGVVTGYAPPTLTPEQQAVEAAVARRQELGWHTPSLRTRRCRTPR
jgi:hypothetical protein